MSHVDQKYTFGITNTVVVFNICIYMFKDTIYAHPKAEANFETNELFKKKKKIRCKLQLQRPSCRSLNLTYVLNSEPRLTLLFH